MPANNTIKTYVEGGIYHIYNRGAGGQNIFLDSSDYKMFFKILGSYLSPTIKKVDPYTGIVEDEENDCDVHKRIDLMCLCLMPNHYHLLLRQKNKEAMTEFTRRVFTKYSMYFNFKYERSGTLFQGRYKASYVDNKDYLLFLSAYIHLNPVKAELCKNPEDWEWSSYKNYRDLRKIKWLDPMNLIEIALEGSSKTKINYVGIISDYREHLKDRTNRKSSLFLPRYLTLD